MYSLFGTTESAIDILWPVFLFLSYPNILSVGGIISVTSLLMLIIFYAAGKFADRNTHAAYRTGTLTHSPTWLLRLLLITPGGLLMGNFLGSATSSLIAISVDRTMYRDMKRGDSTSAVLLFRNYYSALGRISILILAAMTQNLILLFWVVAALTLIQTFFAPQKHEPA